VRDTESRGIAEDPPTRPFLRLLPALVLLALSTCAALALSEIVLRIAHPVEASWLAIYRRHPSQPMHALLPGVDARVDTGETHWRVLTDADGMRVGASADVPTRCLVLWLGDSFTFGYGVDYEQSYVGLVAARDPQARHRNAAVPAYGPVQYRRVLEAALASGERPSAVRVVTFVGNDFHDSLWSKDAPVQNGILGDRGGLKSFLKRNLHLYRLASIGFHRVAPSRNTEHADVRAELADAAAWERPFLARAKQVYGAEMARIRDLALEAGARAQFAILPTREAVEAMRSEAPVVGDPTLPVETARAILQTLDPAVLDLSSALRAAPASETFFRFDGHLAPLGNRIVAAQMAESWAEGCPAAEAQLSR